MASAWIYKPVPQELGQSQGPPTITLWSTGVDLLGFQFCIFFRTKPGRSLKGLHNSGLAPAYNSFCGGEEEKAALLIMGSLVWGFKGSAPSPASKAGNSWVWCGWSSEKYNYNSYGANETEASLCKRAIFHENQHIARISYILIGFA